MGQRSQAERVASIYQEFLQRRTWKQADLLLAAFAGGARLRLSALWLTGFCQPQFSPRHMGLHRPSCAVAVFLLVAGAGCGARTGLGIDDHFFVVEDGSTSARDDSGAGTVVDGGGALDSEGGRSAGAPLLGDSAPGCDFGSVVSNVFGQVVYFNAGNPVPAARYRVTYVDGCMKYSTAQDWAVHAYGPGSAAGNDAFWVVDNTLSQIVMPPGTVGFLVGAGGFASFDDCVVANSALAPVEFDFAGGMIGIWLRDSPYGDNVPGQNGRSPTWKLSTAGCPGGG
jgi:hypothetical protein